jgi:dihydrofolate reductase
MTEIIVWNLLTLNGYFNGTKDWELDWHNTVWGKELEDFSNRQMEEVDTLIFGRKTYEGMAQYWSTEYNPAESTTADHLNRVQKLVFSRSLDSVSWHNSTLIKEDPVTYITQIRKEDHGKYFIFGSGEIVSELHDAGLIDEYRLCYAPVTLPEGKQMFRPGSKRAEFTVTKTVVLKTGGVILYLQSKSGA